MNRDKDLNSHTSRYFTELVSKSSHDPKSFRRISKEHLSLFEEIVQRNIFKYDFDFQESECVGELARRRNGKFGETGKLLVNNHLIH